jgi:hypothetical protein
MVWQVEHSTPCLREYDGTAQELSVNSARNVVAKTPKTTSFRAANAAVNSRFINIFFPFI